MTREHPQRLVIPTAPGSLLKRPQGTVRLKEIESKRDEAYLKDVRQCPCIKCGLDPAGEAAHVRLTSAAFHKRGGMQKTPDDRWALPLDRGCHQTDRDALHRRGEYLFWAELNINPLYVCEKLYAQRGDIVAMRAVIFTAIAERR